MEKLTFSYKASKRVRNRAHVGVAGSGDLEVLMEPSREDLALVIVRTSVDGFGETWKALLDRFFATYEAAVSVEINDFGAKPGVVSLRLAQAMEVCQREGNDSSKT